MRSYCSMPIEVLEVDAEAPDFEEGEPLHLSIKGNGKLTHSIKLL